MKRIKSNIVFFACLVGMLVFAGCAGSGQQQTSPAIQWAQARDALTLAEKAVNTLHKQDVIDDEGMSKARAVARIAQQSLAVAESQLPDGTETFEEAMAVVQAGLASFAASQSALIAKNTPSPPAQPAGP